MCHSIIETAKTFYEGEEGRVCKAVLINQSKAVPLFQWNILEEGFNYGVRRVVVQIQA